MMAEDGEDSTGGGGRETGQPINRYSNCSKWGSRLTIEELKKGKSSKFNAQDDEHITSSPALKV